MCSERECVVVFHCQQTSRVGGGGHASSACCIYTTTMAAVKHMATKLQLVLSQHVQATTQQQSTKNSGACAPYTAI
jgi:hypothetical protein